MKSASRPRLVKPDTLRSKVEDYMRVAVMNGNPVNGRRPLDFDTMPAEEAFDVFRMMRPVVPERTADTLMIMGLHQQVYAALQGGAAPWFAHALRLPTEVGDLTDHGRRKMPAMMCGADGGYLALTYRQINAILRCSGMPLQPVKQRKKPDKAKQDLGLAFPIRVIRVIRVQNSPRRTAL